MGTGPVSGISGLLVSSQIKQGRHWEVEAVRTGLIPHPSALHSLLGKTHGIRVSERNAGPTRLTVFSKVIKI